MWVRKRRRAEKLFGVLVIGGSFQFFSHEHFLFANAVCQFVIGTISSHPSFHQFASMRAIIIPPSIATIMPMSCPQQKPGLGIRRIMSIVSTSMCRHVEHWHTVATCCSTSTICGLGILTSILRTHCHYESTSTTITISQGALFGKATIAHERLLFRDMDPTTRRQVLTSQHYQHKDGGRWLLSSVSTTSRCISENDVGLVRFFRRTFEQMVESGGHF